MEIAGATQAVALMISEFKNRQIIPDYL